MNLSLSDKAQYLVSYNSSEDLLNVIHALYNKQSLNHYVWFKSKCGVLIKTINQNVNNQYKTHEIRLCNNFHCFKILEIYPIKANDNNETSVKQELKNIIGNGIHLTQINQDKIKQLYDLLYIIDSMDLKTHLVLCFAQCAIARR